ncbi:MAG TPA: hypothetical protein VF130_04590 [Candidatus Binatia bacterium]
MDALAQQRISMVTPWLDRWRFTNDGVFMAREMIDAKLELHLSEGSRPAIGKQEKFVN